MRAAVASRAIGLTISSGHRYIAAIRVRYASPKLADPQSQRALQTSSNDARTNMARRQPTSLLLVVRAWKL